MIHKMQHNRYKQDDSAVKKDIRILLAKQKHKTGTNNCSHDPSERHQERGLNDEWIHLQKIIPESHHKR